MEWGGQFENLIAAQHRLVIVVPVALGLIFGLLMLFFRSVKNTLLVFTGVPLALTGGWLPWPFAASRCPSPRQLASLPSPAWRSSTGW
jgi:Cu/Ag efflux pump CusA